MKLNKDMNILIVGLGLLGGSYAEALTKKGFNVSAITRSQSSIDYALENGLINEGTIEIDPEIIGGIYVRIGNDVIDGTLKTRLDELRKLALSME